MRVVLLGAPGSGKGTQAAVLKGLYGIPHISTGDILRAELAGGTELGRKAGSYMNAGGLVPDDLILAMIETRLGEPDAKRGWLLDGFPRTLVQANGFVEVTDRIGQRVDAGIILHVDPEVVVQRLSGRRMCGTCQKVTNVAEAVGGACPNCGGPLILRQDDEPEVVRKRIQVFEQQTRPVFELFRSRYALYDIDASRTPEQVTDAIRKALSKHE